MRRYLKYFSYVCRHKVYVGWECWRRGLIWQGLVHDWDKFRWRMFVDYARFFYKPNGGKKTVQDSKGFYKPVDTRDQAFDLAWLHHTRRSRHHWQYWCLYDDAEEKPKCFPMPGKYILEMYCDWLGAGRAQGTPYLRKWWETNEEKMILHPETRWILQAMIGGSDAGLPVKGMKQMRRRIRQAREWARRQVGERPEDPFQKEFRETHAPENVLSFPEKPNKTGAYNRLA